MQNSIQWHFRICSIKIEAHEVFSIRGEYFTYLRDLCQKMSSLSLSFFLLDSSCTFCTYSSSLFGIQASNISSRVTYTCVDYLPICKPWLEGQGDSTSWTTWRTTGGPTSLAFYLPWLYTELSTRIQNAKKQKKKKSLLKQDKTQSSHFVTFTGHALNLYITFKILPSTLYSFYHSIERTLDYYSRCHSFIRISINLYCTRISFRGNNCFTFCCMYKIIFESK